MNPGDGYLVVQKSGTSRFSWRGRVVLIRALGNDQLTDYVIESIISHAQLSRSQTA
jgi:hypothetical protein